MKDDFLTIPDAPNYEINSEFVCRNKNTGEIFKLETDMTAHPQMREVMNQILAVFKDKLPVIVEDINYDRSVW